MKKRVWTCPSSCTFAVVGLHKSFSKLETREKKRENPRTLAAPTHILLAAYDIDIIASNVIHYMYIFDRYLHRNTVENSIHQLLGYWWLRSDKAEAEN